MVNRYLLPVPLTVLPVLLLGGSKNKCGKEANKMPVPIILYPLPICIIVNLCVQYGKDYKAPTATSTVDTATALKNLPDPGKIPPGTDPKVRRNLLPETGYRVGCRERNPAKHPKFIVLK
jgi:hypothetical protein